MDDKEYKTIIYEPGPITKITHNEPEKSNALTGHFILEFSDALKKLQRNQEAKVGVILSTGPTFCAGHNIRFVSEMQDWTPGKPSTLSEDDWREQMDFMRDNLYYPLWDCKKPLVVAVQGAAYTGGAAVALMCDIVVAAEGAIFDWGVLHFGGAWSDPMIGYFGGWRKAIEMCLTGWNIDAKEAERIGLINKVVPADMLEAEVIRYAKIIAAMRPEVVKLNKQAARVYMNRMGAREALWFNSETDILGHLTKTESEVSAEINKLIKEQGMKVAMAQAHKPFEELGYRRPSSGSSKSGASRKP